MTRLVYEKTKQFNKSNIGTNVAALTLTLSINWPLGEAIIDECTEVVCAAAAVVCIRCLGGGICCQAPYCLSPDNSLTAFRPRRTETETREEKTFTAECVFDDTTRSAVLEVILTKGHHSDF